MSPVYLPKSLLQDFDARKSEESFTPTLDALKASISQALSPPPAPLPSRTPEQMPAIQTPEASAMTAPVEAPQFTVPQLPSVDEIMGMPGVSNAPGSVGAADGTSPSDTTELRPSPPSPDTDTAPITFELPTVEQIMGRFAPEKSETVPTMGAQPITGTESVPSGASTPVQRGPVSGSGGAAVPLDMSNPEAYKRTLMSNAQQIASKYDLPAAIIAAIPIQEAGYGGSELTKRANNLFSIKGTGPAGSEHFGSVWEVIGGQNVQVPADFRKYNSAAESFEDFAKLITETPRYAGAVDIWKKTRDPNAFIQAVQGAGYATDPTWAGKVASIASGMPAGIDAGPDMATTVASNTNTGGREGVTAGSSIPPAGQSTSLDFQQLAKQWAGKPYVFGGAGGRGGGLAPTDCSGFVAEVFKENGVDLPAHTDAAYNTILKGTGRQVSESEARPGDVVFYMGAGTGGAITHHMGLYAGPGTVLDMSTAGGGGVKQRPIGHGGEYVILRDERMNPDTGPTPAPATLARGEPIAPSIVPTGVAEESGGVPPAQEQIDQWSLLAKGFQQNAQSFANTGQEDRIKGVPVSQAMNGVMAYEPPTRDIQGDYAPVTASVSAQEPSAAVEPAAPTPPAPASLGDQIKGVFSELGNRLGDLLGGKPDYQQATQDIQQRSGATAAPGEPSLADVAQGASDVVRPVVDTVIDPRESPSQKLLTTVAPGMTPEGNQRIADERSRLSELNARDTTFGGPGLTPAEQDEKAQLDKQQALVVGMAAPGPGSGMTGPTNAPSNAPRPNLRVVKPATIDPVQYPELGRLSDSMKEAAAPSAGPGERPGMSPWERTRQTLVRHFTDSEVNLTDIQRDIATKAGHDLPVEEQIAAVQRLSPNSQMEMQVQREIMDPLREIGTDRPNASMIATLKQNIDQAREMGFKAEREFTSPAVARAQAEVDRLQNLINSADAPMNTPTLLDRAQENLIREQQAATVAARQAGETVQARRAFSGGLNAADSEKALADLQQVLGPERYANAERAANAVTDFNRGTLKLAEDGGLIPPEEAARWRDIYPNYTPTNVIKYMDSVEGVQGLPAGKRFSLSDPGFRKLTEEGTTAAKQDPIAASVAARYDMIRRVNRNKVANMFIDTAKQDPELAKHVQEIETRPARLPQGSTIITAFDENAVKHDYLVDDWVRPYVFSASTGEANAYQKFLQTWKESVTGRSLSFSERNFPRDARQGLNYLITMRGGPSPANVIAASDDLIKGYRDAFSGITQGKYSGSTADYLAAGGFGGRGAWGGGLEQEVQTVDAIARTGGVKISNPVDLYKWVTNPLAAVNAREELGSRSAIFKLAREQGLSDVAAVIKANDYMPYEVAGDWARATNRYVPFLTARIAGVQAQVRLAQQNPGAYFGTVLATTTAPAIAAQMWNRSDPDRSKAYDDVPPYMKYLGDVVMLPWAGKDYLGGRLPNWLFLPTGSVGPFSWLGHGIGDALMGNRAQPHDYKEMFDALVQNASPVDVQAGSAISQFAGPVGSTAIGLWANKDPFRGSAIVSKQNDIEASRLGHAATAVTNMIPGVNVHPSQVDYAVRQLGGYPGTQALGASDIGRTQPGEASNIQDIPGVGGLIAPIIGNRTGGQFSRGADSLNAPWTTASRMLSEAGVQWRPEPVDAMIGKVPLTRTEHGEIQQETNQIFNENAANVRQWVPDWDTYDKTAKETVFKNLYANARKTAEGSLIARYPDRFALPEQIRRVGIDQERKAG